MRLDHKDIIVGCSCSKSLADHIRHRQMRRRSAKKGSQEFLAVSVRQDARSGRFIPNCQKMGLRLITDGLPRNPLIDSDLSANHTPSWCVCFFCNLMETSHATQTENH